MCVIISMKKRPTWTSKISSFILCKEYLDIEIHFQNLKTSFSRNQYNTFIFDASYLQKLPNNKSFYGKYPKRKKIRENWFISFHYFFLKFFSQPLLLCELFGICLSLSSRSTQTILGLHGHKFSFFLVSINFLKCLIRLIIQNH